MVNWMSRGGKLFLFLFWFGRMRSLSFWCRGNLGLKNVCYKTAAVLFKLQRYVRIVRKRKSPAFQIMLNSILIFNCTM